MAMMPTREHNAMLASLMGPWYSGSDFWVGIYNWAYYDYYFRLKHFQISKYENVFLVLIIKINSPMQIGFTENLIIFKPTKINALS